MLINTNELVKSVDFKDIEDRARKAAQRIAEKELSSFFARKTSLQKAGLGSDIVKECVDELLADPALKSSIEEKLRASFNKHLPEAIEAAGKRFAQKEAS